MNVQTQINGREIIWKGHLCEGTQFIPSDKGTFCLWTRCGEKDVPANAAKQGSIEDVHCTKCLTVWKCEK